MTRINDEVDLLRRHLGRRSRVTLGRKTIGGRAYTGVHVSTLPIGGDNFSVSSTDALLLLPPDYPAEPPVGIYVNFPWDTQDHHFTQQSYYAAPDLRTDGWYWYCVGLGGGFETGAWGRSWRPARQATGGHNLVTLVVAAQHAIRNERAPA